MWEDGGSGGEEGVGGQKNGLRQVRRLTPARVVWTGVQWG